jgi:hypothetical protein
MVTRGATSVLEGERNVQGLRGLPVLKVKALRPESRAATVRR